MPDAKHILVTGGAGFLGSHLVESLLADGHRVTALDNLWTGRKENLAPLQEKYGDALRFLEGDVRHAGDFPAEHLNQIYNLACPASPPH